jgi:hypothetical protein
MYLSKEHGSLYSFICIIITAAIDVTEKFKAAVVV